jgi:DNA-directed RNA polymerase subunit RPC12/RpoP
MRIHILVCDICGSARVRRSKRQSLWEVFKMLMGVYPFRCLDCSARFWVSVWLFSKLPFAKCPKCLSTELTNWPEKYFPHGLRSRLALTFGAHHYRCHRCRFNFMSFRPRRTAGLGEVNSAIWTE